MFHLDIAMIMYLGISDITKPHLMNPVNVGKSIVGSVQISILLGMHLVGKAGRY
jgi:hypothetical protein